MKQLLQTLENDLRVSSDTIAAFREVRVLLDFHENAPCMLVTL